MSKPHEAPTFYVPAEDAAPEPGTTTDAPPRPPGRRRLVSATPAPLIRYHTSRDWHDADVGALDAGFGFLSLAREDVDVGDGRGGRRKHGRTRAASLAFATGDDEGQGREEGGGGGSGRVGGSTSTTWTTYLIGEVAAPVRRAITDTVHSRDARVRHIAASAKGGTGWWPSASTSTWFGVRGQRTRQQGQGQGQGGQGDSHAPHDQGPSKTTTSTTTHTTKATPSPDDHHAGLLAAIRNDFKADRELEAAAGKELAEVRAGGTGEHAYQQAHAQPPPPRQADPSKAGNEGRSGTSKHTPDTGADGEPNVDIEAQSVDAAAGGTDASDETVLPSEQGSGDAEKGAASKEEDSQEADPNLVGWDSPDDPANPRNWSNKRKWLVTTIVSSYTLLSPLSSSMIAPALPILDQEFGITNQVQSALMLSTFVLAYAIGPLLLGGLSEMYGRLLILQCANLLLIVFTMAGGLAQSSVQMTIFRFFAGLGGSAPLTIGGGVVSDLYTPDQRGKAMAVYSLAPLLGPCIGPIVAGWIIQSGTSWRWIFWVVLIASGAVAGFGFLTLPETYAPVILAKKRNKLRKETGNRELHTIFDIQRKETFATRLWRNFIRPFIFMTTQPSVQALSTYMMIVYGVMYVLLSDVDATFRRTYNEGPGIASLHYISLGLGFTAGGQVGGRLVDRVYRNMKKKNNGVGRPEFKLPFMCVASPFVPAGLLLYGWTIEYGVHWIVPDIGLFFFGLGMMSSFLSTQNYLVDTYQLYAASAVGAAVFLRSVAGFALPLAAPSLYGRLGNGWGNSVLALIAAVVGIPAPVALFYLGPWLRKKSKYASTSF